MTKGVPIRNYTMIHIVLLVLLTLVVFSNTLHGAFVFDDATIVPQVNSVHSLEDVLHSASGWRQLLTYSYALNYLWGGVSSFGYHLVNVLLHALNVALVYLIIRKLMEESPQATQAALVGAAVFSVHTLLTGAVAYVSGRSSILCAVFYFAAILSFLKGGRWLLLTSIFAFLAWETKQEAITLPLTLAGLTWLRGKRDWWTIATLVAVPIAFVLLMRDAVQRLYSSVTENTALVDVGFDSVLSAATYFRTYLTAIVEYVLPRFLVPVSLSIDPIVVPVPHWYSADFLFTVVMFGAILWVFARYGVRDRLLGSGIVLLFLSPLMAYSAVPLADVVQENRAYIPAIGAALLFAWALQHFHWTVSIAVVATLCGMTLQRNEVWRDEMSIWQDAVEKAPLKARAHYNLGMAYKQAGKSPDAIRQFQRAVELKPNFNAAYSNLSVMLVESGKFTEAEALLLDVTRRETNFIDGFTILGALYLQEGQAAKSIAPLNRAIEISPESFSAHDNKANALTQLGDYKGALDEFKSAVNLRPDLLSLRMELASGYRRFGNRAAAEKEYLAMVDTAVVAEACRFLGDMYRESGQMDKAIDYVTRALRNRSVYPDAHQDLGALYLGKQNIHAAIQEFETAIAQQPDHGLATLNLSVAYQMAGNSDSARTLLENYLQRFGTNSPYSGDIQARLKSMK